MKRATTTQADAVGGESARMHCRVEPQERTISHGLEVEAGPMRAAGLDYDDIIQLARLKRRIKAGEVSELTMEHKRLLFVKCLVASGRIHD